MLDKPISQLQAQLPTERWIAAIWNEYLKIVEDLRLDKASCYYHNGKLRIEMPPLGYARACDPTIITFGINLLRTLKSVPLKGLTKLYLWQNRYK